MKGYILLILKEDIKDAHYPNIDDAVSAFIHTCNEVSVETYMQGRLVSSMDLDRQVSRLREVSNSITRFKMGEIKHARFDMREQTIILKRAD